MINALFIVHFHYADFIKLIASKAIRKILGISRTQVEHQRITNVQILHTFQIESIRDIAYSRQLRWIGKIARMGYYELLISCLETWLTNLVTRTSIV